MGQMERKRVRVKKLKKRMGGSDRVDNEVEDNEE